MSLIAIVGAALAFGIGIAHSYLGERYIIMRLFRRPDLPPLFGSDVFTRRTIRLAWHLTTVAWWGLGVLLLLSSSRASRTELGAVVAGTFAITGLIILVGSRGRHLAWPVFVVIAAIAWLASR